MEKTVVQMLFVFSILPFCQGYGETRLAGGSNNREGRVEIFMHGEWGTVCGHDWNLNAASVVCRSLGLPAATAAPKHADFGYGVGPIWIYDLDCDGSESSLTRCWYNRYEDRDCGHDKDAGVVCGVPGVPVVKFKIDNLTAIITSPGYPEYMERAYYEWTFVSRSPQTWPPLYIALYFEDIDLHRENGTSCLIVEDSSHDQYLYVKNDRHEPLSLVIDRSIGKVIYYSSLTSNRRLLGSRGFRMRYNAFTMPENDQVCNKKWNVSFIQNHPGRINVTWLPVPHQPGSTYTYLVFYEMVQRKQPWYERNFTIVVSSRTAVIEFLHPNRMYSVQLIALGTSSLNSTTIYVHSCPQLVKTLDVQLRLAGGNFSNEGRVEVFYHGMWGNICADWWGWNDANVVCRSLGLPDAIETDLHDEFGGGSLSGKAWETDVRCTGTEKSLTWCPYKEWTSIPSHVWCVTTVVCGHPQVTNINITDLFGEITSPGYPHYIRQAHYVWSFKPSLLNASIAIYFEDVDLESEYGSCSLDFKDPVNDAMLFIADDVKLKAPAGFISPKNTGKMVFTSSFTTAGKGFLMRYFVLDRNVNEAPTRNASIVASSTSPHSISVDCSSFTVDGFKVLGYLITCNSADNWHRTVFYAIADNKTKNASFYQLVGLTNYKVHVFAVGTNVTDGSMMMYKSETVQTRTMEGVPSGYAYPLSVVNSTTNTMLVRWIPMPRHHAHGVVRYRVYYQETYLYHRKNITTNHSEVLLNNLLPGMQYYIYVRGLTSKGEGQTTGLHSVTKCGRQIENQLTGTMANPNYRYRDWSINCMWTLRAASSRGLIVVLLDTVDVPVSRLCRKSYVALDNGQGKEVYRFCGLRKSFTLTSFGFAKIRSYVGWDWSIRYQNFVMKATYYIFDNGFYDVPLEPTWNISAKSISSSTINVQWSEYPLSSNLAASSQVMSYLAVCISVKNQTNISVANTNGTGRSVNVNHLGSNTEYFVQVVAVLSISRSSTTTVRNDTSFQRSTNTTIQTMEDVLLRQPPPYVYARLRRLNNVLVRWDPIPSQYIHGILLGYHVHYTTIWKKNAARVAFVYSNQTSVMLHNLDFSTKYRIQVAGVVQAGEGPRSHVEIISTGVGCDKNLSGQYGRFSSPRHPSYYPSDADCKWTIGEEMKLDEIIIFFDYFRLQKGTLRKCSHDYVKIVDSKGNELGQGRYCGKKSPFAVVSQRPADVVLYSDSSTEDIGFSGKYYVIDEYSMEIDLRVISSTKMELMLGIKDLGVIFAELVVLYKENESQKTWNVSTTSSLNITIRGLLPSKEYEARAVGYFNGRVYKSQLVTITNQQEPEKLATTRSPSTPRPPSEKDIQNSVNVTIQGLNITEWNHEKEKKFKGVVAEEVTNSCGTQSCLRLRRKQRHSNSVNVTFTKQEIHLLPGYPVQLSYSSIPDHMIAVVSFYVKFPPGVANGFTDTVDKTLLVDFINGSLAPIGKAINKTILSVSAYMVEKPTDQPTNKPTTSTHTKTEPTGATQKEAKPGYVRYLIIGGSVVGALLIMIIIVALTIRCVVQNKKVKKQMAIELKTQLIPRESRDEISNLETSV